MLRDVLDAVAADGCAASFGLDVTPEGDHEESLLGAV